MRALFTITIFLITCLCHSQVTSKRINKVLSGDVELVQKDTNVVLSLLDSVQRYLNKDYEKTTYFSRNSYNISMKLGYVEGEIMGLYGLGNSKVMEQDLDSATYFIDAGISLSKKVDSKRQLMNGWRYRGNCYYYTGEFDSALEVYFKSLKIADKYFPENSSDKYSSVGFVFWAIGNDEKANEYFEKGLKLAEIYKDTSSQIFSLNNLGIIKKNAKEYEASLAYYERGLALAEATENLKRMGELYANLSNLYFLMGEEKLGFEFLNKSGEITEQIGSNRDKSIQYYNIGYQHTVFNNDTEAIKALKMALEYAESVDYKDVMAESHGALSEVYARMGDYRNAYSHSMEYKVLQDSIALLQSSSAAYEIEQAYELEKIALEDSLQKEKVQLEKDHQQKLSKEKLKSREKLLWLAGIVIILIIVGLIFLIRTNKAVKQKNAIITERNSQITQQKEEIEEQHKEITDSINYAQRIQGALLSGNEEWDKISMNHFIFFQPKDVVSGDFYWAFHSDEEPVSIWVTADCTGHGVPGAFMSMLGIGFLNEIVVENGNRKGSDILHQLRKKIIKALAQKGAETQQKDGMDLSLCIWDRKLNVLEFTGANNPLYIVRQLAESEQDKFAKVTTHKNGFSLIELPTNKIPVGFHSGELKDFHSYTFQLQKNDVIISFTDGFADQFGGEKGKKLKYRPFKDILLGATDKPVKLQGPILSDAFNQWKRNFEQIDDVCVIGVRVVSDEL